MSTAGEPVVAPEGRPGASRRASLRVALDVRAVSDRREGIGNYTLALAEGLAGWLGADAGQAGRVEVLMLGDRHTAWDRLPGFPHHSGPDGPLWHAWAAVTAGRLADVYHSTGSFFAPLLTLKPVVLTVHDIVALRHPATQRRWTRWTQGALGLGLHRARVVLAVSEFTAREVASEFPHAAAKIHAVLHAARSLATPATSDPLPEVPPVPPAFILAVGSLEPRKNLVTLLGAHARMDAPPPLVLVGHRRWRGEELDRALADHPHAVQVLTEVSDVQLATLYGTCGVFVFPSRYEGFGLPVLEAMACGAPVVASSASAIPEAAGGAALLFDPDDPGALAIALERVLGDPDLRADLVERGRVRAAERTWTDVARETVKLYERATMSP